MKEKAAGHNQLLIVDGHNSHYSRTFLQYARENSIIVICYPAHTTHILQGLDVIIFALLKCRLTEEHDLYERRTGKHIGKNNFLEVYGKAHNQALTLENIKAAFRKTGLCPFDPSVIPAEAIAPSKKSS